MTAAALLDALRRRQRIESRTALIAAHPDDETIGAGASLPLFDDLLLIHITDGAPRSLQDANAAGFPDAAAYAAARRGELIAALREAAVTPRLLCLALPDQQASLALPETADRLGGILSEHRIEAVITHAYEGGHPDHDATACITHTAIRRLSPPPPVLEMHGYFAQDGTMQTGRFLGNPGLVIPLDPHEQDLKRRMLARFVTQSRTLAAFGTTHEAFRPAPAYDFTEPPHTGTLHYERYEWGMTGARFRDLARALP